MRKPFWTQTLAWVAASVIAFLLALAGPDDADRTSFDGAARGAELPR